MEAEEPGSMCGVSVEVLSQEQGADKSGAEGWEVKLNLKSGEHLRVEHDGGLGFTIYVNNGVLHVTAKKDVAPDSPYGVNDGRTTMVIDSNIEVVK